MLLSSVVENHCKGILYWRHRIGHSAQVKQDEVDKGQNFALDLLLLFGLSFGATFDGLLLALY